MPLTPSTLAAYDRLPCPVYITDLGGQYIFFNAMAAKVIGISAEDAVGLRAEDILDAHEAQKAAAADRIVIDTGEPQAIETRLKQDDRVRIFQVNKRLLRDTENRAQALISMGQEITAQRKAERGQAELLKRHKDLLEVLPVGVVEVGVDGQIEYANPIACDFLGLSRDDMSQRYTQDWNGETFLDDGSECTTEEYPVTKCMKTAMPQGPTNIGVRRPNGKISWGIFSAQPVFESGKLKAVAVVIQDVTALREHDQEKQKLREQLHHAHKLEALGTLAGGVAHDMNNLLAGMILVLDYTQKKLGDEHELAPDLQSLRKAGMNGAELLGKLLRFARRAEQEKQSIEPNEVLGTAVAILERTLDRRVQLERDFPEGLSSVVCDPADLLQIFLNLVLNAAHAIDGVGTIRLRARSVTLDDNPGLCLEPGQYVEFCVEDDGAGMPPETLARALEPFFTTKARGEGTGLGLSMAHGSLRQFGGALSIESEPKKGTRVTFWLPAQTATDRIDVVPKAPEKPIEGDIRILLVDDEPLIRRGISLTLEEAGYSVHQAKDGEDALKKLSELTEPIDLVLIDLSMPVMDGERLFDEMRRREFEMPVLLCTGLAESRVNEMLKRGISGLMLKPFNQEQLLMRIAEILRGQGKVE